MSDDYDDHSYCVTCGKHEVTCWCASFARPNQDVEDERDAWCWLPDAHDADPGTPAKEPATPAVIVARNQRTGAEVRDGQDGDGLLLPGPGAWQVGYELFGAFLPLATVVASDDGHLQVREQGNGMDVGVVHP